nr:Golgi-associated kinase 1A [Nothobranchius furzeri]
MNWQLWLKLCSGQKGILLLSALILLLLMVFIMTVTLPLPLPPLNEEQRLSQALSSAELRSKPGIVQPLPAAALQPPAHYHGRRTLPEDGVSKHSVQHGPLRNAAGYEKNSLKARSDQSKGFASKRRTAGSIRPSSHHHYPQLPDFTVNSTELKHSIKPSSHSDVVKQPTAHTHIYPERIRAHNPDRGAAHAQKGRHTNRNADTQLSSSLARVKLQQQQLLQKPTQAPKASGKLDGVDKEQLPGKRLTREHKQLLNVSGNLPKAKWNPGPSEHGEALSQPVKPNHKHVCESFRGQDFPDSDDRKIRVRPHQPPSWFSNDDIEKMELLSGGDVISKARVPAHGQVLQVALNPPAQRQVRQAGGVSTHRGHCQQGCCSLIKRTEDWFEVFAFHLDRVLGINRSLPAVLRMFHSDVLPYRFTRGSPRPVVWWDPDIQHLADNDNDQNSVPLGWVQYQKLLQARCENGTELRSDPCVGVRHSEWGRLALFDFLLQVSDRLDRYCCGFTPDPTDLCVENLLHSKCGKSKDLLLVHILVRKADPSRLVFIDNAGRPQQPSDNLNFRLLEGIEEFPERAVSVLRSGCLETLLLRSLYTDKEFWDSRGGAIGLRPLVHIVEQRGQILLQHIRTKRLRLLREL